METIFQNSIEVSLQLSRSPAPEETPFLHKYEAINILNNLLKQNCKYHFITHCVLGEIYNDVEQNSDSVRSYQKALEYFTALSSQETHKFY